MRTPTRPLPEPVARWIDRARHLRWLDGAVAWLVLWIAIVAAPLRLGPGGAALLALALLVALALLPPLRLRWRPATAIVALALSRALAPGDRAWFVWPDGAELVIVTARHSARLTIARSGLAPAEGMSVRRTRALLVRADDGA